MASARRVFTMVGLILASASSLHLLRAGEPSSVSTGTSSDSSGFLKAAHEAEALRVTRRVSAEAFARMAKEGKTVIVDARSKAHFDQLRIKGSINLPYTEMAEATLGRLIPDKLTRILIYCRNNLAERPAPVPNATKEKEGGEGEFVYPTEFDPPKFPTAGLNIPTYITLYIYGYRNIWELDPVVDPNQSIIEFETGSPSARHLQTSSPVKPQ